MTNLPRTSPGRSNRRRSWSLAAVTLAVAFGVGVYLSAAHGGPRVSLAATASSPSTRAAAATPVGSKAAHLAPNGVFTTAEGATDTVASLNLDHSSDLWRDDLESVNGDGETLTAL